jgi:hypothetical protein
MWAGPTFLTHAVPLMLVLPVVMPMRDPLAALLSLERARRQRNLPPAWLNEHVDVWVNWVELHSRIDLNVFHFPVDTPLSEPQRVDMVERLLKHLGLPPCDSCDTFARNWNPVGVHPSPLKTLYKNKDIEGIRREIPEVLDRLQSMTDKLQPLMLRLGYKETLWW